MEQTIVDKNLGKKNTTYWKWLKAVAVILVIATLTLVLLMLLAKLLEDKIKTKIITEVNQQIDVPVKVDGDITLSLIRHFPYASLTFSDISIDDRLNNRDQKLLQAEEFSLLCNIFSLFGDELEFSKVVLRNGELNLVKNSSGKTNFEIFKKQSSQPTSNLSIQLKKALIKSVHFTFNDYTQSIATDVNIEEVLLGGNFGEESFKLHSSSKLNVAYLRMSGEEFLSNRNLKADISLNVNKARKKYEFTEGAISIDNSEFTITGFFATLKNNTQLDFKLLNGGKDIQQLFSLFPEKYKANFAHASGTGEYAIVASVKGNVGKTSLPDISASVDLKNSEIQLGRYNKLLKNVNAKASYSLAKDGTDKLQISNFNCTLNEQPFNFKLSLVHLSNPDFDFYANGILHVEELQELIPDSLVQDMGGTITFNNFHLKGSKRDFTEVENSSLTGSGEFRLNGIEFRQNGVTYGNINGLLKYENQLIDAQNFTFNFLSTDFNFTGTIENLFPYVFNLSTKRRANDIVLGINGSVKTQTFNLSGILETYDKKNRPQTQVREKIKIREIFNMKGNLVVDMERFVFRQMNFTNLKTNLLVAPGMVQINQLSANAMKGQIRTAGLITFTDDNSLNLNIDLRATELNIPQIFSECENFGQTALTDKNLKGTVSIAIVLNATWKNYKELDESSLSAIIDYQIKNGELIKFEPLKAASKFIKMEELEDIRFADLENTVKIGEGRIDVPEFEIKTSALNLMFFGYHYFNNDIDYHFKINLHKLLAQKFSRRNQDADYIESDPYEGVNIYLTMTGNLSNPKIKFDKSSVRKKVLTDFRNEKDVLKGLLKNSPRIVNEAEQKREEKYFDIKEQPQFMDFDTAQ